MLDLRVIRKDPEKISDNCRHRNLPDLVKPLLKQDELARRLKGELDTLRQKRNEISNQMKVKLSPEDKQVLVEESKLLKQKEEKLNVEYQSAEIHRSNLLSQIPNLVHPDSPIGLDEDSNKVLCEVGEPRIFDFEPKDHLALMENLDLVDFEGGSKVVGKKFYYLKNQAVFLELALAQYALKLLQDEGFTVHMTPDLARASVVQGTGFQPRGDSAQIYSLENSDLCLIATAEITLGGLLSEQILLETELPILMAGFSHCFRTEAGAAGRESRGLYRVHQFSKIEMFAFTHPDESNNMHGKLLEIEERIYRDLEIPYRVVDICTGDLGAPAYRKYDLEAWMPGRKHWGEVTSTSNCTDYQARRLNIRFKDSNGKNQFVHMLNGTAIAVSRTLIALIENGQQADGSIKLPKCLGLPDIPSPASK
jgi:seryl-tRNA synthetase